MPNIESLIFFAPEMMLSLTAILLIIFSVATPRVPAAEGPAVPKIWLPEYSSWLSFAGLASAMLILIELWDKTGVPLFGGLVSLDRFSIYFRMIFVLAAAFVVIFSQRSKELLSGREGYLSVKDAPEYYSIMVGMVIGMCMLASTTNILVIYLSLEFVGLMSYVLVAFQGTSRNLFRSEILIPSSETRKMSKKTGGVAVRYVDGFFEKSDAVAAEGAKLQPKEVSRGALKPAGEKSKEAGLKYLLFGAVASGVFLFGASIFYGLSGTLELANTASMGLAEKGPFVLAGVMMLSGFLFKIAAVPMQAWCPDAYEGAPTPITAFLSVAPKAAGFAVLMRVADVAGFSAEWPLIIAVISAATMTFGNLAAIPQTSVKRLLAYSSIAHAGYILMGVACATPKGNEAVYFYLIAYLIMNLGAFLAVEIVINATGSDSMDAFAGLGRRGAHGTLLAVSMTIFLLSLTGVPPFVGFIGKFYLFWAVLDAKLYWLAVVGILNSVISLYYYMRIVKAMFLGSEEGMKPFDAKTSRLYILLVILALLTLAFGLAWGRLNCLVSAV